MGWLIILIVVVAIVGGIAGFLVYKSQKGQKAEGALRIYKAFQDAQLVILHESKIDQEDLVEFVKALAGKDVLFKNDPQLLNYIDEYYKRCVDLNRKNERIRITQTKADLELLMSEQRRMVEWFREQDKILGHLFARYVG